MERIGSGIAKLLKFERIPVRLMFVHEKVPRESVETSDWDQGRACCGAHAAVVRRSVKLVWRADG